MKRLQGARGHAFCILFGRRLALRAGPASPSGAPRMPPGGQALVTGAPPTWPAPRPAPTTLRAGQPPTWMVVIPASRPTRTRPSSSVATRGASSFMKSATRWVTSTCQSGPSRRLGGAQGPAPSDRKRVSTRTVARWYCRAQPRPRRASSSSSCSSLACVGLRAGGGAQAQGRGSPRLWGLRAVGRGVSAYSRASPRGPEPQAAPPRRHLLTN